VELELEQQGLRLRLKKAATTAPLVESATGMPQTLQPPAAGVSPAESIAAAGHRVLIKSPMVGTFYRAPAPDAPPFVEVGQELDMGQVVCIIEAMKLMNEIKSDVAGLLREVLAQSGDAVEFGQPLFCVEPST
jgi:acetyl-CoA carboxylase biotin carboxyl carrier protein